MIKNIIVVDESGNEYEATYPKRAKGLVKNGRARFVDENKICLVCPPNHYETEDIEMSDNKTVDINNEEALTQETKLTPEMIFQKIGELQAQLTHPINSAVALVNNLSVLLEKNSADDMIDTVSKRAVEPFFEREKTFMAMIALYEKLLDSLFPKEKSFIEQMKEISDFARGLVFNEHDERVWAKLMLALDARIAYIDQTMNKIQ